MPPKPRETNPLSRHVHLDAHWAHKEMFYIQHTIRICPIECQYLPKMGLNLNSLGKREHLVATRN
jgi:hypothetical protein